MADVNTQTDTHGKRASPRRRKKRTTRIDMTAMVDVAFLLLTFFVLTATISQDHLIQAVMPPPCEGEDCYRKVEDQKILTLLLNAENKLFYYHGTPETAELLETTYSAKGLRKVLFDHLFRYPDPCQGGEESADCWDPIFVIKPQKDSRYANLINVIDEMEIARVKKYVIADLTVADSILLKPVLSMR